MLSDDVQKAQSRKISFISRIEWNICWQKKMKIDVIKLKGDARGGPEGLPDPHI